MVQAPEPAALVIHHVYISCQHVLQISNKTVILTSSEQSPLAPIHGQQYPCPQTHALRKVHASPQVYCQQAATEAQPVEIKNGRVADVR